MRFPSMIVLFSVLLCSTQVGAEEDTSTDFLEEELDTSFYARSYRDNCAVCHGNNLEGAAQGSPLTGVDLKHGDSVDEIIESIASGFPQQGMPAWSETMTIEAVRNLALFISEKRQNLNYGDFKYNAELVLPEGVIETELHGFTIETLIEGLDLSAIRRTLRRLQPDEPRG